MSNRTKALRGSGRRVYDVNTQSHIRVPRKDRPRNIGNAGMHDTRPWTPESITHPRHRGQEPERGFIWSREPFTNHESGIIGFRWIQLPTQAFLDDQADVAALVAVAESQLEQNETEIAAEAAARPNLFREMSMKEILSIGKDNDVEIAPPDDRPVAARRLDQLLSVGRNDAE